MRGIDSTGELRLPSYELFSDTEVLGRMAMERMLAGLSTRRYRVGVEPVGQRTEAKVIAGHQHLEVRGLTPVRRPDRDLYRAKTLDLCREVGLW